MTRIIVSAMAWLWLVFPVSISAQAPAAPGTLPANVRPVTDEDRAIAFPNVGKHKTHDKAVNTFVLFDQLEWQGGRESGASWDNKGWIGGDRNRLWFRSEGDFRDRNWDQAQAHALYGRSISRWWDVVAGIRQDFRPGPAQTWGAIGLQGLAPYWFEVEATAYIGTAGRTHFRVEGEYELLLNNRLILQPLIELELYGKNDPTRYIGAGLSNIDTGLRLRYEIRREFAPYIGFVWDRKLLGTADYAVAASKPLGGPTLAFGIRVWR
jgi:copper resistance protein B